MLILGIWDGHDAGAALVEDGKIKIAVNEERLSRKKLDIGFPVKSIKCCLDNLGLKPSDVDLVACVGTQLSRVLARQFSFLDESFYLFRRRKIPKPCFERERRLLKYWLARYRTSWLRRLTEHQLRKKLKRLGFRDVKLRIVEHHSAHAAAAIFTSGFPRSLCITLDGVGDGLSGTITVYENGEMKRIAEIPERDSIGLFFEQVTTLLGFRELEDEGKVMALADFAYPYPKEKNPFFDFFSVDGMSIKARHGTMRRFLELEKLIWKLPRETAAYFAQQTLEEYVVKLFANAIAELGICDVCWSGGVAANIKLNRRIRLDSGLKNWFVFPHMGDGGLALGAALYLAYEELGILPKKLEDVYLGVEFSEDSIEAELKQWQGQVSWERVSDPAKYAADLLNEGNYVFWFQGRMEYGPRALGNRSILAPPDSLEVKEKLNLAVKRREWFQPFCPTILEEDAARLIEDYTANPPDRFMTMGYIAKKEHRQKLAAVIHVDGSLRPQILGEENKLYRKLISEFKKRSGLGVVLNTSFNVHGEPIVASPKDAIETMLKTGTEHMFLGNFYVTLGGRKG